MSQERPPKPTPPPKPPRRAAPRKRKKKPRTLEKTVTEIAQRPPPIRRSIFDLLDTLIKSREPKPPEEEAKPAEDPPPPAAGMPPGDGLPGVDRATGPEAGFLPRRRRVRGSRGYR